MIVDNELPDIHSFNYESNLRGVIHQANVASQHLNDLSSSYRDAVRRQMVGQDSKYGQQVGHNHPLKPFLPPMPREEVKMSSRRMVQVYIVDPDEQVPVSDSLVYKGDPKLTDLTDQELFYEIDILNLLKAHNTFRVTLFNKKVKERQERLEPIRIRDLSMLVVTLAEFRKP